MKLATFSKKTKGTGPRLGALTPDQNEIVDITAAAQSIYKSIPDYLADMNTLIESGPDALDELKDLYTQALRSRPAECILSLEDIQLHVPLKPVKLRCFSVYEEHLLQAVDAVVVKKMAMGVSGLERVAKVLAAPVKPVLKRTALKDFYAHPTEFKGNHLSVVGPDDPVRWPSFPEDRLDYEMELAVVIGTQGRDIKRNDARPYIFGYTCFNDFSARSTLIRELTTGRSGPMKGKDFDTGNALGPWIVTADSIADPYDLIMEVKVNGQVRGRASTGQMYHTIESMIEQASRGETLYPGEVFGTGCAPNGAGIESGFFLSPGDVVEVTIDGIGTLRNQVVRPTEGAHNGAAMARQKKVAPA